MGSVIADYRSLKSYAQLLREKAQLLDVEANRATSSLTTLGQHHQDAVYEQLAASVTRQIQEIRLLSPTFQLYSNHLTRLSEPLHEAIRVFFNSGDVLMGTSTQIWLEDVGLIHELKCAFNDLQEDLQSNAQDMIQELHQQLETAQGYEEQVESALEQANSNLRSAESELSDCEEGYEDSDGYMCYPSCSTEKDYVSDCKERCSRFERALEKAQDLTSSLSSEIKEYTEVSQQLLKSMDSYRQELLPLLEKFKQHLDTYSVIRLADASVFQPMTGMDPKDVISTYQSKGNHSPHLAITNLRTEKGDKTRHEVITAKGGKVTAEYTRDGNSNLYYMEDFTLNGKEVKFKNSRIDKAKFEIQKLSDNEKVKMGVKPGFDFDKGADYEEASKLRINWIEVPETYQRQKLGAALVESIEAFAREKQYKKVEGSAKDADAKAFFMKMGYHFPTGGMDFEKIL